MTTDTIQRFTFENADIRGFIIRLDDSLTSIMHQHQYPPAIANLLGEALMASALIFATLNFKGRLIIQLRNQGPIKLLVAKCNQHMHSAMG